MIDGLQYVPDYLDKKQQVALQEKVDEAPWMNTFKRRVQHYGYVYDYRKRNIDLSMHLGALPHWLQTLADALANDNFIKDIPDQVIVNEYYPGQGIAPHIDCEPCFTDTVVSISLGSSCMMNFSHVGTETTKPISTGTGQLISIYRGSTL